MSDKIARLSRLLDGHGAEVMVDEAVEDTMKDLAGYCVLWLAYQEQVECKTGVDCGVGGCNCAGGGRFGWSPKE